MKLSKEKTKSIIIKAQCNSEWDTCNYCLIQHCTQDTVDRWKQYVNGLNDISNNSKYPHEIHCLSIWEHSTFLVLDEEDDNVKEIAKYLETNNFAFVELEKNEEDTLTTPQQRLDSHQARIYKEGGISFLAYGKNTSEEFWADGIDINKL